MPLTESERRVLAAIDVDALVADLSALVQVPSLTGDEAAVQERAAELCAAAGLATETWELDLDELRAAPGHPGEEAPRTRGVGVEARLGEGERRLVLNGHLDVVAPGTVPWSRDPWSGAVEEGRVHGRGALDMKGGVTCALHALRAIRAAGVELDGEAVLTPVVSEEDGGLGTFAAIRRLGRIDAAIIPEPSAMELVIAQAGALTFAGVVQGVAAHAAFRLEGESAIDRYLPLHANLHALERERNTGVEHTLMRELDLPYPILIGRLDAGEWSSMVPDRLRFEGRVGVRVGEPPAEARAAVEQLAAGVAELTWEGGAFASGEIAADHPLTVLVRAAAADVLGSEPPLRGVPYGADMRLFTQQGIPCLIVGPGDPHGAHTVDESIGVAELELGARVLALATVRYLGVRA